jgi:hypothetical protein
MYKTYAGKYIFFIEKKALALLELYKDTQSIPYT